MVEHRSTGWTGYKRHEGDEAKQSYSEFGILWQLLSAITIITALSATGHALYTGNVLHLLPGTLLKDYGFELPTSGTSHLPFGEVAMNFYGGFLLFGLCVMVARVAVSGTSRRFSY